MVRKSFFRWALVTVMLAVGLYAIVNLFTNDKTWFKLVAAAIGFALLPTALTIFVKLSPNIQPLSKTIVLTGVWTAWTVMAFLALVAIWSDWYYFWPHSPQNCLDYCYNIQQSADL